VCAKCGTLGGNEGVLEKRDGEWRCRWGCNIQTQAQRDAELGAALRAVTRFEVIDHRSGDVHPVERGRIYAAHECSVELSYQDGGRTLKVFVTDRAALSPAPEQDEEQ
jgi:hypothetical protein